MDWITDSTPTDHKQKLTRVYNYFQNREFYALAFYDPVNRWGQIGGKVTGWMDLDELIKDSEMIDRILKAEPDLTIDGLEYIERGRAVRILRGMEKKNGISDI